jgi:hypothetical protein
MHTLQRPPSSCTPCSCRRHHAHYAAAAVIMQAVLLVRVNGSDKLNAEDMEEADSESVPVQPETAPGSGYSPVDQLLQPGGLLSRKLLLATLDFSGSPLLLWPSPTSCSSASPDTSASLRFACAHRKAKLSSSTSRWLIWQLNTFRHTATYVCTRCTSTLCTRRLAPLGQHGRRRRHPRQCRHLTPMATQPQCLSKTHTPWTFHHPGSQ